jgi:hypothetical protein
MNKKEYALILDQQVSEWLENHTMKKLKFIKPKNVVRKPNSMALPACPDCGSKLIVELSGLIICSQDRIRDIYNKCLEYEKADVNGKIEILKNDKNGNFMELYERWNYKDINGSRSAFTCNYSNKIHSPIPNYNWWLVDTFQKKRLEKILKRPLSQAELDGQVKVKFKNKKGYYIEESVIRYRFPWDL